MRESEQWLCALGAHIVWWSVLFFVDTQMLRSDNLIIFSLLPSLGAIYCYWRALHSVTTPED